MYRQALARPVSTVLAAATAAALGGVALLRLPVALLPAIERPRLVLTQRAPDRSREELLSGLTEPIERRLASLSGVTSMRSETADGFVRVVLETEWQTDADRLRLDAARRIEGAGAFSPAEETLTVGAGETAPVVEVALRGGTPAARAELARKALVPDLARLPGAGRIDTLGLTTLRAVVRPRAASLAARGLTRRDLTARLSAIGLARSAGRVRDGPAIRPLVVRETVASLEELKAIRVPSALGSVPLSDLAEVTVEEVDEGSSFHDDGQAGGLVRVWRAPGANAAALARRVREVVERLGKQRSPGAPAVMVVVDHSREVVTAIGELGIAVVAGLLLGTLVLRLFLGGFRPTLALAAVIPAALLVAFAAFDLAGIPLDVVSLGGLAIAAGMLVDSSIVVLESIESARARGEPDAALAGTRRVARAVTAGTLTAVIVFLPLAYLRGLARAFFGEQAFAVVVSLLAALALSLTLTPVLARRRSCRTARPAPGLERLLLGLDRALAHPLPVLLLALAVALGAGLAAAGLRHEIFPAGAARVLRVDYRLAPALEPREAAVRGRAVEDAVAAAAGRVAPARALAVRGLPGDGAAADAGDPPDPSRGRIDLHFESDGAAAAARAGVARALARLPDVEGRVALRPGLLDPILDDASGRLEVVASAPDAVRLHALVERVERAAAADALGRPRQEPERRPVPITLLDWDEARLARLQIEPSGLDDQLVAALAVAEVGRADIPGIEPEIRVEAMAGADLAGLPVVLPATAAGSRGTVPLGALASLRPALRPARIRHEEGRPAERVVLEDASGREPDPRRLERRLARLPLAPGESVRIGGKALEVARAFAQLRLALALSLVLVFLAIAALYESLVLPLAVMATVPLAAAGGLALLRLTSQSLSIPALLGLLMLCGISVNNAIVLVDRIEGLRGEGRSEDDAIRAAVRDRYRPILMTTLTALLGMLPLALLGGEGTELRRGLATAVLGGLVTGTAASLIVVPVLHRVIAPWRRHPREDAHRSGTDDDRSPLIK